MLRLAIDKTWNGGEAAESEIARLVLCSSREGLRLEVEAPFHDDPRPPAAVGSTWELWRYEVIELFVLGEAEHYTEIELGPHGHYLVLRCEARRKIVERHLTLDFRPRRSGSRWSAMLTIPWDYLPEEPFRLNAYCIHGQGHERRYLAWQSVPGKEPDFHRLEYFLPLQRGALTREPTDLE